MNEQELKKKQFDYEMERAFPNGVPFIVKMAIDDAVKFGKESERSRINKIIDTWKVKMFPCHFTPQCTSNDVIGLRCGNCNIFESLRSEVNK